MEKMIIEKIIHKNKIRFFDEFLDSFSKADLEDLFTKPDYLELFNSAFTELSDIKASDLDPNIQRIILQINKHLSVDRFNHFRPANELIKIGVDKATLSHETKDNFEKVFKEINGLFS